MQCSRKMKLVDLKDKECICWYISDFAYIPFRTVRIFEGIPFVIQPDIILVTVRCMESVTSSNGSIIIALDFEKGAECHDVSIHLRLTS